MSTLSLIVLLNGAVKAVIYGIGVTFTWYRRRGLLCAGFGLAFLISAARAVADAQHPTTAIGVVALLGTPAAGLIVASFIANQPSGDGRPDRWLL